MSDDAAARSTLVRQSGRLSLLTMVSRVLGLVREMTRAAFMGTGALADAFTLAFIIPNFLRRLFAEGSITVAFIPTFKGYLSSGDRKSTEEFMSAMFTMLAVLVTLVTVAGIALAPAIVQLFTCDRMETAALTRIMFPYLALVAMAAFLQGILNSIGVFTPTGVAPILFNVCFILVPFAIAPFAPNPARAMAVGVVVGGLAQAMCQLPAVIRGGFRFGFVGLGRAFRNPGTRRVLTLIAPTVLGMAAYQLNDLVCTAVASNVGTGVATSLTFSLRLQELILGVFAVSIGTVLLPDLTDHARRKDWPVFSDRLKRGLEALALITVPLSVFSMLEGRDIVALLFKSREFTDASVDLTATAFFFHMIGLFFIAANRVIAPAFYARGDTKNPTWAGIAAFVLNIVLAITLARPMRGGGIALALSLSSGVNLLILTIMLLRMRLFGMRAALFAVAGYVAKMVAFSALASVPVLFVAPRVREAFLGADRLLSSGMPLLAGAACFGAVGVTCLVLTRDRVALGLIDALTRRRSAPEEGKKRTDSAGDGIST